MSKRSNDGELERPEAQDKRVRSEEVVAPQADNADGEEEDDEQQQQQQQLQRRGRYIAPLLERWFGAEEDEFFDGGPFLLHQRNDGLSTEGPIAGALNADWMGPVDDVIEERHARRVHFARPLSTYRKGQHVSKHCEPYGARGILFNKHFEVRRKFFDADGELTHILVRVAHEVNATPVLLDRRYFAGWCDDAAMDAYFNYHR